jgi:Flp pilus assembly CpaE family ATPase
MKKSEVESALGVKIEFEIPSDRAVPLAVNRGAPVVMADPGAEFSKAVRSMAKSLVAPPKEAKKNRRLLPSLAKG